jgi:hypothetical protein
MQYIYAIKSDAGDTWSLTANTLDRRRNHLLYFLKLMTQYSKIVGLLIDRWISILSRMKLSSEKALPRKPLITLLQVPNQEEQSV